MFILILPCAFARPICLSTEFPQAGPIVTVSAIVNKILAVMPARTGVTLTGPGSAASLPSLVLLLEFFVWVIFEIRFKLSPGMSMNYGQ